MDLALENSHPNCISFFLHVDWFLDGVEQTSRSASVAATGNHAGLIYFPSHLDMDGLFARVCSGLAGAAFSHASSGHVVVRHLFPGTVPGGSQLALAQVAFSGTFVLLLCGCCLVDCFQTDQHGAQRLDNSISECGHEG